MLGWPTPCDRAGAVDRALDQVAAKPAIQPHRPLQVHDRAGEAAKPERLRVSPITSAVKVRPDVS